MIEIFDGYNYEIFDCPENDNNNSVEKYYYYRIYNNSEQGYVESEMNVFNSRNLTRIAAIGHISMIIKGKLEK